MLTFCKFARTTDRRKEIALIIEEALVNAFVFHGDSGNPAGVVVCDAPMDAEEMQKIAKRYNVSETAFVYALDDSNYCTRFFTPETEVDLCGHATVATFWYMAKQSVAKGKKLPSPVFQHCPAGCLKIDIEYDADSVSAVFLEVASPVDYGTINDEIQSKLESALNLDTHHIQIPEKALAPRIVSTGLKTLLVPVASRALLNRITPNREDLIALTNQLDIPAVFLYTIENSEIFTRVFAPAVGIDEECATGTATANLAYWLYHNHAIQERCVFYQGEAMNRLSRLETKIAQKGSEISIMVGGQAK